MQSLAASAAIDRVLVLNRSGESLSLPEPIKQLDLLTADVETCAFELTGLVENAVLMIHSGVKIVPDRFAGMVEALRATPVDGLLPAARLSESTGTIVPPLGGSPAFSLNEGATFTGALLVRRQSMVAAGTGRTLNVRSPFLGLADFCVTGGRQLWPYPEAVVEWNGQASIEERSALPSRLLAYDQVSPNDRYYMLASGYGPSKHSAVQKRELALALVDMGLAPLLRVGMWGLPLLRAGLRGLRRAKELKTRLDNRASRFERWIR